MQRSKEDYEKIGRAIVARVEAAKRSDIQPLTVDNADFVRRDSRGRMNVNIVIDHFCAGCGLPARLEVQDGILRVTTEPDPLHLGDR